MKKEIYFIRHGETEYNRLHRVQGSGIDASLNEKGEQQAQAFFDAYQHLTFDKIYVSKLKRTEQTVEPFIKKGIPFERWQALNEISWGSHEGKVSTPEMVAAYHAMIGEWAKGNFEARLGGGESANELQKRLSVFLEHLKNTDFNRILVCSHGRALRCLLALMKEEHLREMEKYDHHNTGLFLVELQEDTFTVLKENDITHLSALPF